jgi:predicted amidohydrolase
MKKSSSVKLGLIQMSMSKDPSENLQKATHMISSAANNGAQIVCLPELFNSLYFPQHEKSKQASQKIPNNLTDALSDAAKENKVVLIGGSIYENDGKKSYNTAVVFDHNGNILGKYRKVHIPNDPSFYEQTYFTPGNDYPVFETKYGKIGVLICFDQWYPEPARILRLMGANIIFYPTAIGYVKGIEPVEGDWHEAWEAVQRGHAIANSVVVASVNRVGVEGEMNFWGGSFLYDQFGTILKRADNREQVVVCECNFSLGKDIEEGWGFLRNRRPKTYSKLLN